MQVSRLLSKLRCIRLLVASKAAQLRLHLCFTPPSATKWCVLTQPRFRWRRCILCLAARACVALHCPRLFRPSRHRARVRLRVPHQRRSPPLRRARVRLHALPPSRRRARRQALRLKLHRPRAPRRRRQVARRLRPPPPPARRPGLLRRLPRLHQHPLRVRHRPRLVLRPRHLPQQDQPRPLAR